MITTDILIIGGGIMGISIARELNARLPDMRITLIEKESTVACHASGRNSGVLHAGFYYTADSLKARFTMEGNRLLTGYCLEHGLAIDRCGKIVVARNEDELKGICELKQRGDRNGVKLDVIDEKDLAELEPNAKTFGKALYSPATSVVKPKEVVEHLASGLLRKKVNIVCNEKFIKRDGSAAIITNKQKIHYKHLVNAAGLYADKVAHQFGVGEKYTLLPFKGIYMEYKDSRHFQRHIYPVPNLGNPFLGVHFTKTADGKMKIGPTAIPAFWRENYQGISHFNLSEFLEVISAEARLFFTNSFNFRSLALQEIKKYSRKYFIRQAVSLAKNVDVTRFGGYLTPGIRAQLLNTEKMNLVMDFVVEQGENSTHILNAVSPAFTAAFSFSKHIVDEIEGRLRH